MAPAVGIMTFLHNENCGSSLQAWALQETLREFGYPPLGLDYRPDRFEQMRNLICSGNSPAVVLDSFRRKRGRGQRNTAGFAQFRREHLTLSEPCKNAAELRQASEACGILLCGSDQIWSPEWLNPVYFLCFRNDKPKIAYAASLGLSGIAQAQKRRKIRQMVEPFHSVSVREEEGAAAIRELLPEKNVEVMPDPVILLQREAWLRLAGNPRKESTLVCYFLRDNPAHWQAAEDAGKEMGLRLRVLGVTEHGRAMSDTVPNPDPVQWLREVASASAVITDSFHGAAMAAILEKPLIIRRRWQDGDPASKNSRLDQLKRLCGWTDDDRCLPDQSVRERIGAERMRGRNWLQESLRTVST